MWCYIICHLKKIKYIKSYKWTLVTYYYKIKGRVKTVYTIFSELLNETDIWLSNFVITEYIVTKQNNQRNIILM